MDGTLAWPLTAAVRSHASRTAIIDGPRQLSYAELGERAERLGTGLTGLGVGPSGVVATLMNNILEQLECWLAVPAHGRVVSTLNTRLSTRELQFMLTDCGAEVLIVDSNHLETGRDLMARCPSVRHLVLAGFNQKAAPGVITYDSILENAPAPFQDPDPEAIAAIMYTGGTTGRPKGVLLTHRNLIANAKHLWHTVGLRREDRFLYAGPLFHAATSQFVHPLTWVGGTHVMIQQFDAAKFVQAVAEHEVTSSLLVPTMIQVLVSHLRVAPRDLPTLRLMHYGASPMSIKLLKQAMELLGCEFVQGYGMTETSPAVTFLSVEDHRIAIEGNGELLKSVGYAVPGVQVAIRTPSGDVVPDGEVGEIWVRGPNVMRGYLNREEETEAVLVDGWYRTGDGGYSNEDGYLFLVDRLKDMIVTGGENVYSIEVEQALATHPAVVEVAVLGMLDDTWGERVHAIVVLDESKSATEAELTAHCRESIARFKVPKSWDLRTTPLPKSGVGKIQKKLLRNAP